jgi:hypothetical protein
VVSNAGVCTRCGVKREPSDLSPLQALRPEAEPPLPAAHDLLRTRTPPLGAPRDAPEPIRPPQPVPAIQDASAAPRALVVTETPLASAPGPMVDPSAWFEESKVREPESEPESEPLPPAPDGAPRMRLPSPPGVFMTPTPQRLPGPEAAQAAAEAAVRRRRETHPEDRPTIDVRRGAAAVAALETSTSDPGNPDEPVLDRTAPERALSDTGSAAAIEELHSERPTARGIKTARDRGPASSRPPLAAPLALPGLGELPDLPADPGLTGGVPTLIERSPYRRAAIAILVCILVGAAVGWLISSNGVDLHSLVPKH